MSKNHVKLKHILAMLLAPWVIQILFNVVGSSVWNLYWPLVLVTSIVPLAWLIFRRLASAYAALMIQVAVFLWFNWHNHLSGKESFSGESAFVGGLGAVYVVSLSMLGGLIVGGALYLFRRQD